MVSGLYNLFRSLPNSGNRDKLSIFILYSKIFVIHERYQQKDEHYQNLITKPCLEQCNGLWDGSRIMRFMIWI